MLTRKNEVGAFAIHAISGQPAGFSEKYILKSTFQPQFIRY
jgi:hypothetical protein